VENLPRGKFPREIFISTPFFDALFSAWLFVEKSAAHDRIYAKNFHPFSLSPFFPLEEKMSVKF